MKIKELKEAIKDFDDNADVILVGWDYEKYESIFKTTHQCCNREHQKKVGEFWLSNEGLVLSHK